LERFHTFSGNVNANYLINHKSRADGMYSAAARLLMIACFVWTIFPSEAYAYLDPGSATLLLQTIVVGFVFLAVTARSQSRRIKQFVKDLSRRLRG
jgi:hypothetical protein